MRKDLHKSWTSAHVGDSFAGKVILLRPICGMPNLSFECVQSRNIGNILAIVSASGLYQDAAGPRCNFARTDVFDIDDP